MKLSMVVIKYKSYLDNRTRTFVFSPKKARKERNIEIGV